MAKSTRSKTKRAFRRSKREESVYAATHAARLERLSKKLGEIAQSDKKAEQETIPTLDGEMDAQDPGPPDYPRRIVANALAVLAEDMQGYSDEDAQVDSAMDEDKKKVSTHGRRLSRRQEWRTAKGLPALKKSGKINRQGTLTATRRAGRSKRRR